MIPVLFLEFGEDSVVGAAVFNGKINGDDETTEPRVLDIVGVVIKEEISSECEIEFVASVVLIVVAGMLDGCIVVTPIVEEILGASVTQQLSNAD